MKTKERILNLEIEMRSLQRRIDHLTESVVALGTQHILERLNAKRTESKREEVTGP